MNRLLFAATLLAVTPAFADIAVQEGAKLPADLKPRGKTVQRVAKFEDKNGTNYVAFSSTDSSKPSDMGPAQTRWLYIDHWAIATGKKPRSLLPARDMEQDCPLALVATFVPKAFTVTDLDKDGIAEITYGYQLACRSDVSPAAYKLLLVENGKKHILRGTAVVPYEGVAGGEFTPEPVAKTWPKAFYDHAVAVWNTTDADLEIH